MSKKLTNKVVFITGASSGIGEACAIQCAEEGAHVILAARRIEKLQKLAERLKNEFKVQTLVLALDVRNRLSVEKNIQNLPEPWKEIDILINNAGLALELDPLAKNTLEDCDIMIDTNIKGLLYMTKALLPEMLSRNEGHIVNIASLAGHETYPGGTVYCATKHAVIALSEGLRKDLFGTKIRVSLVSPGAVKTELSQVRFKGDEAKAEKVYQGYTPLTADDIAESILFCITRKPHININEIIILPTDQASVTMIHKKS